MQKKIAALYIDRKGIYPSLDEIDLWDENRDARLYEGPHPVVAHPPCHLWVNFAHLNFKRYGGEHNRPGNDGGCFASALAVVRKWGGVLEHPASSNAWKTYGLLRPAKTGWERVTPTEWVCEIWQNAYGHAARKRTWLLYSSNLAPPCDAIWTRSPGTKQVGWFDRIKPTLSKKEARQTPLAFARFLVNLARRSAC